MVRRRYWIPSTSALLAFESAACHCNFSRAAEELNTSQSAISRHIAALEERLSAQLFDRHKRRLRLTEEGEQFFRAVTSGLEDIQSAAMAIANAAGGDQLTLACTHEISHLFLMPQFEALQKVIGEETRIRVLTLDYDTLDMMLEPQIDVIFTYQAAGSEPQDRAIVSMEAVTPVCSPVFAETHRAALAKDVTAWGGLTFLTLTKQNRGWATWDDWFARVGTPEREPATIGFDNYVYLLEAASAGRGLALGWRGMVERYLEAKTLVALTDQAVAFNRPFYAVLTRHGRDRPAARKCLAFFEQAAAD